MFQIFSINILKMPDVESTVNFTLGSQANLADSMKFLRCRRSLTLLKGLHDLESFQIHPPGTCVIHTYEYYVSCTYVRGLPYSLVTQFMTSSYDVIRS